MWRRWAEGKRKNNLRYEKKYSVKNSHEIGSFHPRVLQKSGKPLGDSRISIFFTSLGWNYLILHGYSYESLIFIPHY